MSVLCISSISFETGIWIWTFMRTINHDHPPPSPWPRSSYMINNLSRIFLLNFQSFSICFLNTFMSLLLKPPFFFWILNIGLIWVVFFLCLKMYDYKVIRKWMFSYIFEHLIFFYKHLIVFIFWLVFSKLMRKKVTI